MCQFFKKLTNPAGINALLGFFLIRLVQWTAFTAVVIRESNACYSKLSSYSMHSNSPFLYSILSRFELLISPYAL